jgi:hypothetical protein
MENKVPTAPNPALHKAFQHQLPKKLQDPAYPKHANET